MKAQDFIDSIKGNLGNRASGRIGSDDVDVAVLRAVNLALPHVTVEARPDYYSRTTTLNLVAGQRKYDLPTVDSDGNTIRIKDIYNHRCSRAGGTEVCMKQVNYHTFVDKTINYDLDVQGTPSIFALWGQSNQLYLDYLPSEALTLTLYVETYPSAVSALNLSSPLPLDEQWLIVAEAYATQYLYLKLQQLAMQSVWMKVYEDQKATLSRDEGRKQGHNISGEGIGGRVTDPVLNPMVRSWN